MAAALVAAASLCTAAGAALNVPFVPQGEDLCGGAAAAMVMRYWGARGVSAEAFAPLVDRPAGGIRTGALASDLRSRGWTAVDRVGDMASVARDLDRGRPVIALIEVRRSRYHFVVIVGLSGETVVFHDPARGPSRVMSTQSFESAWAKSDHWTLLLLPGSGLRSAPGVRSLDQPRGQVSGDLPPGRSKDLTPGAERRPDPCGVTGAIAMADGGDYAGAHAALERATATCGADAAPWRELAGLDALETHWDAAAAHARRATELDPRDAYAWRTLATAEYLRHHDAAALAAWNHVGEPAIDLIDVTGLRDTRYAAVADAMGIAPGQTLTPAALRLAERRARDVPSVAAARVTFRPVENGRAQVDAAIVERDRAPAGYPSWIALGMNAAANREATASFANPSGGGDLATLTWRWWAHRPLIGASYAAPAPRALGGGTWHVEASRETQTFAPASGTIEETRTRAAFGMSRWLNARTRVGGSAGIESWSNRGRTPSIAGRFEYRPVADRLVVEGAATAWIDANGFATGAAAGRWRSSALPAGFVWLADAGYQFASGNAPAFVWPGADTGHARDVLLRAHPLLEDGVIGATAESARRTAVFGRRLAFGNAELQHWQSMAKWPIKVAPAAFVDVARARRGFGARSTSAQIDTGVGLRLSLLGLGMLRADVARGLRDGHTALSIAFVR